MLKFHSICNLKDLSPGKKKKIEIGDEEILVANVKGEIYATQDRCGHMGVSLSRGEILDSKLECPLHGSIFDIKTGKLISDKPRKAYFKTFKKDIDDLLGVLGIPPVKIYSLKTYPTAVKDGKVLVGIDRKGIDKLLKTFGVPPVKIKPLRTYPTEVKKGKIYIGMEEIAGKKKTK